MAVKKPDVSVPYSRVKENVAKLLKTSGFIEDVKAEGEGIAKKLSLQIAGAKITEIERISRPGRRVYMKADDIPVVKRGRGIVIVSTSKGLMTGDEAKKSRAGGELICKVY
jgi:small subunit ribosomal protein S8